MLSVGVAVWQDFEALFCRFFKGVKWNHLNGEWSDPKYELTQAEHDEDKIIQIHIYSNWKRNCAS